MKIAVGLPQVAGDFQALVAAARQAEEAGAWGVWTFDNLAPLLRPELPSLEGWMVLGPLARATSRVRLISLVTRASLRHPALVARMGAVVQSASGGRLVLGLGAGDAASRSEERRFGFRGPGRAGRLADIRETVRRLRSDDLAVSPLVAAPEVWVAGIADDLLVLATELASAWHGWGLDAARFADKAARVRKEGVGVACWWGGMFDPRTTPGMLDELHSAGADGVTLMIASSRDAAWRPMLLELVRARRS